MKKYNIYTTIFILILMPLTLLAFMWPIGRGTDEGPQHVTATFGEFRYANPGSIFQYYITDHFHDGVDIVPKDVFVSEVMYGTEPFKEDVWRVYYSSVRTKYHDYFHVTDKQVYESDSVSTYDTVATSFGPPNYNHLHFNSRVSYDSLYTANNPLDPNYSTWLRFSTLYPDYTSPKFNEILFVEDGNPNNVLNPNNMPEYTNVDIIVKAEERTEYPGGVDDNNGVYKLMYGENFLTDTTVIFNSGISSWDIGCIYDTTRTDESNYYYIVTNEMSSNGYWNTGHVGEHFVYIRIEDEQGRFPQPETTIVVDVYSSGLEEERIDHYFLHVNNPVNFKNAGEIKYGIPEKSKVNIRIFDSSGRLVKEILDKEKDAGKYTLKWNGKTKKDNNIPAGIYYCKMKAEGDFIDVRKLVILKGIR